MSSEWRDRKHWMLSFGFGMIERWCIGAPCRLLRNKGRHPIVITLRLGAKL